MTKFPTESTYRAPITVLDHKGDPHDGLGSADIEYRVTEELAGENELYSATEADSAISVDPEDAIVTVEIPAPDVDWTGTVWEELRVDTGRNAVVLQRSVEFHDVAIPP